MRDGRTQLLLVVESGTDVRLVEGLAQCFEIEVVCRRIRGGFAGLTGLPKENVPIRVGPASRLAFASWLLWLLFVRRLRADFVVSSRGYALARALSCNIYGRVFDTPVAMLVCSPVELYYRCRRHSKDRGGTYRRHEEFGLRLLAWLNTLVGQRYFVLSEHLRNVVQAHGVQKARWIQFPSTGSI